MQTHPLQNVTVVLAPGTKDPQRGAVVAGARFRVEDWYVNMDPEAIEPLVVPRNWAEKWYLERALANHLPLTDLVYGKIGPHGGLGHIVHASELGEEASDGVS